METKRGSVETTGWQARVRPAVEDVLRAANVPGLVLAVAWGDAPPEYLAVGADAAGVPLDAGSILPVAAVTKLATALGVLRLAADGALALDDPLARYLPEAAAAQEGVTLRTLLAHTSGLPYDVAPELAPYAQGLDWATLARACLATPLAQPPSTRVIYSNVGPGLLAIIVERLSGKSFPDALDNLVLRPLGIEGYLGTAPPRPAAHLTGELGEHMGTDLEPYNSAFHQELVVPWGGLRTTAAGALALVLGVCRTACRFPAAHLARRSGCRPDRRPGRGDRETTGMAALSLGPGR